MTPKLVARGDASCWLAPSGRLSCWGAYATGQPSPRDAEAKELAAFGRVVDVALGHQHLCALDPEGGVKCVEATENGRGPRSDAPKAVRGLGKPTAIVAGENFACVLERGVPTCFGDLKLSWHGPQPLGPTRIEGITDAVELAAGARHACARLRDGGVHCWGQGASGVDPRPSKVEGVEDAVALSADGSRTCALLRGGSLSCWGDFRERDPMRPEAAFPLPGFDGVTNVAVGPHQICAVRSDGTVVCSGENAESEGGAPRNRTADLVHTSPRIQGVRGIATGTRHACALLDDGVACWGSNAAGALGDGTFEDGVRRSPTPVEGLDDGVRLARGESSHSCALLRDGGIACWGQDIGPRARPQRSTGAVAASLDLRGTCTVFGSGKVACRGDLTVGAGAATTSPPSDRVEVAGVTDATDVAVSAAWGGFAMPHACALLRTGRVACWGGNSDGQLGDGTRAARTAPVRVTGLHDAVAVSVGLGYSCAARKSGEVLCWGRLARGWNHDSATLNREADLRDAGVKPRPTPIGVTLAVQLAGTAERTCAVLRSGEVTCWARPPADRANGGMAFEPSPVISQAKRVAVGFAHACVQLADGAVACWGDNRDAQLGDGERSAGRTVAERVPGISDAVDVAVGRAPTGSYSCALRADGTARCWGATAHGQFTAIVEEQGAPHRVRGLTLDAR